MVELFKDSELLLFLSVDVSGSTALKNQYNHSVLLDTFSKRKQELINLSQKQHINLNFKLASAEDIEEPDSIRAVLHDYSQEDSDWQTILEYRFKDFHNRFETRLNEIYCASTESPPEGQLWKFQGDEFIYHYKINGPDDVHNLVVAFLSAIRHFDKQDVGYNGKKRQKQIRLKGTGWVAGFPIRNRKVAFFEEKSDFLGPEMDTGFRLGKHNHDGFMTVSVELAEILGDAHKIRQIRGMIVGWQSLKGVWDGKPYPIIWITLPEDDVEEKTSGYQPFSMSEAFTDRMVHVWQKSQSDIHEIKELTELLKTLRKTLPASLGLVTPYFGSQSKGIEISNEHKMIHSILNALPLGVSGSQDAMQDPLPSDLFRTVEDVGQTIGEELEATTTEKT